MNLILDVDIYMDHNWCVYVFVERVKTIIEMNVSVK